MVLFIDMQKANSLQVSLFWIRVYEWHTGRWDVSRAITFTSRVDDQALSYEKAVWTRDMSRQIGDRIPKLIRIKRQDFFRLWLTNNNRFLGYNHTKRERRARAVGQITESPIKIPHLAKTFPALYCSYQLRVAGSGTWPSDCRPEHTSTCFYISSWLHEEILDPIASM